jgi:hypothetical protein
MPRNFVARRKMTGQDWTLTVAAALVGTGAVIMAWLGLPFIGVHL